MNTIKAWLKLERLGLMSQLGNMWHIVILMIMFPWICMRNYITKLRELSPRLCIVILSWIMVSKN